MHYRDFRQDEEDGRMAAVSGSGGSGAGLIPACLAMLTLVSCLGMVIEYHTITQDDALLDPWEDQTVEGLRNRGSSHLESTLSDLETEVTAAKATLHQLQLEYERMPPLETLEARLRAVLAGNPDPAPPQHTLPPPLPTPPPPPPAPSPAQKLLRKPAPFDPVDSSGRPGHLSHRPYVTRGQLPAGPPLKLSRHRATVDLIAGTRSALTVDEIYRKNPFVDPDGGAWTQGFKISYLESAWTAEKPLKVWVVPHSHNDPGWIKTFQRYFQDQTTHIISRMLQALDADHDRTFVWAEMSYLSMWWDKAPITEKDLLKRLVSRGQLEIVSGGWVMPDEANTHYYALVDQMIEGQQWLESNIGAKPRMSWSIDPFGQSPTMAYLLRRSGFEGMLIQRVHYEVKRVLAESKNLEFGWRQEWDTSGTADIFTHMMPFYSYDVPHTCGPEPAICCQFDFARLPGGKYGCPWKKSKGGGPPQQISKTNVAERAALLLDQYKKKSTLYRSNNVLAPLGDDFRWDNDKEIEDQFRNYQMLMDHVNSHPEYNVEMRWGTLSDYFLSVWSDSGVAPGEVPRDYPVLSGDFFTYADRKDNYWSGYYTSRPFYKHLDRILEGCIRAAEIYYSLGLSTQTGGSTEHFEKLQTSRRELGLFQHHDGVTGTAKTHVMEDYGKRLARSVQATQSIVAASVAQILDISSEAVVSETTVTTSEILLERKHINVPVGGAGSVAVAFTNPLTFTRLEMVSIITDTDLVEIRSPNGSTVKHQTNPVFNGMKGQSIEGLHEVWFEIRVPVLGVVVYKIHRAGDPSVAHACRASIKTGTNDPFVLTVGSVTTSFGRNGMLQRVKTRDVDIDVGIEFVRYGSAKGDNSGAYLFMPDTPRGTPVGGTSPLVQVISGPLISEVHVIHSAVHHIVRLNSKIAAGVEIVNIVDIRSMDNTELVMRLKTGVKNGAVFYTDNNGFQMRRRETLSKIPTGGNFFPLAGLGYLEDSNTRLSLHTRSSVGCAGLEEGWFEVVLDRRLTKDDNRGLFQAVNDNDVTPSHFILTVEAIESGEKPVGFSAPSQSAYLIADRLSQPAASFVISNVGHISPSYYAPLKDSELPCDVYLLNLKALQPTANTKIATLLHHRQSDPRFQAGDIGKSCAHKSAAKLYVDLWHTLAILGPTAIEERTITLMHPVQDGDIPRGTSVTLDRGEIHAWSVTR